MDSVTPGWVGFDVTARVRRWAGQAAVNHGWRVTQAGGVATLKRFTASEEPGHPALRPRLTIEYLAPVPNTLPTVSLTSPAPGARIPVGTNVTIAATAGDTDGTVSQVAFYADAEPIGAAFAAPYTVSWRPTVPGTRVVTAVATDDRGGTRTSNGATVTIENVATTEVILQRGSSGYAGATDTYLDRVRPAQVSGAATTLFLDLANYVPLVRFAIFAADGGPVPNGATIESATLEVYKQNYEDPLRVHALLVPWQEGVATWNIRQAGVPWNVAGAGAAGRDYDPVADAVVFGGVQPGWVAFDVTARVRKWGSQTAPNHGWRMMQSGGSGNLKQFTASEEVVSPTWRPRLKVRYR
jgi:hypothetical protein